MACRRKQSAATWLVASALVATWASSCGGDDGDLAQDRHELGATFAMLQSSFEAQNVRRVCSRLTVAAQRQVGSIGHGKPTACAKDLGRYFKSLGDDDTSRSIRPRIERIALDGADATVITTGGPGSPGAFTFAKEGGRWKLASLFSITKTSPSDLGTPVRGIGPLPVADSAGPVSRSLPVKASAGGSPCPDIGVVRGDVEGGCKLNATTDKTNLRLSTMATNSYFASCRLTFSLSVDGSGRFAIEDIVVGYAVLRDPCGDILPCRRDFRGSASWMRKLPWHGRFRTTARGRRVAEIDLCFDSCAGRLQGRTTLAMIRAERGWELRADRAHVGRSGLELSGGWKLAPLDLDVDLESGPAS